jgi:DNA-binding MarR family transcriptional regulator
MYSKDGINGKALLGKRAEELSNLIEEQSQPIFDNLAIIVPIKSCSTLLSLSELQQASVTDLARQLDQSHQLVKQKLPKLLKLGVIQQSPDKNDKRRTLYSLTPEGKKQSQKIKEYLKQSEKLVDSISQDIGIDIFDAIDNAIKTMKERSLLERFRKT